MDYSLEELRELRLAAVEKRQQELQSAGNAAAESQDEAVREPQGPAGQAQGVSVQEPQILVGQVQDEAGKPLISAGQVQDQAVSPQATAAGLEHRLQLLNSPYPVVSSPAPTMNMVCIQAEDFFAFLKNAFSGVATPLQEVSGPMPKVEVSGPMPKVDVPGPQPKVEVPSPLPEGPDVLFMGKSRTWSPLPDYSWMLEETPPPVFDSSVASPDPSLLDFEEEPLSKRSTSPSWRRHSLNGKCSSSASTNRPRSRSPSREYSFDKPKKPTSSSWRSSSPPSKPKPSCSASASKPRSRSSSPDLSFLYFKDEPTSNRSTSPSWQRLFLNRKCSSAYTSRPRSRSPSPEYSFDKPKKPTSSSWRSRSPASKPKPSCSASASKPRSRSSSPDLSFLDFKDEPTSNRSTSPSWRRLSLNRKCSSAYTSRPRSRSPPEYSFEKRSKKPTLSYWRSRSPASKPKPSCSASASKPRSRSSSPEFSFVNGSPTSRRKSSSQSHDPDYVPNSKKVETPKEPKAPPKKRGRPPKSKEPKKEKPSGHICPICREVEGSQWVNTQCGHSFHKMCLTNWANSPGQIVRELKVCPSCGVDYDPDKVNPLFWQSS